MGVSLGNRKLDTLIGADRPSKYDAVGSILGRPLNKPVTIADGFGSDQNPFDIPSVDDVAESFTLFSDAIFFGNLDIFKPDRRRVVVDHDVQRLDVQLALHVTHIHDEHGQSLRLVFQFVVRRCSSQQKHEIRLPRARNEYLLPIDNVLDAFPHGAGFDARGL